ncbi:MAG: beta-galactosidase [Planctomycetota bacterium]|nr:MAG: beta-galactosidase [Planctomycetota bacterium]
MNKSSRLLKKGFVVVSIFLLVSVNVFTDTPDPYEKYIKTSKDFKRVKQDKDWAYKAWPSWIYMPWYYKWGIGKNDAGGKFSKEMGYNGAFTDHNKRDYLPWINKYKLRFYNDHTAGKGDLLLYHKTKADKASLKKNLPGTGMRRRPVNDAMVSKLKGLLSDRINTLKSSPYRSAYSLDDEISWGSFVRPTMWKITSDKHYRVWLKEIYGEKNAPANPGWASYNSIRKNLKGWKLKDFDCHQMMDQWTFNDSFWNNFLGDLVEYANSIDPATPVGFVGAQSPNTFGGFDYAKVMRKVQFIEAYGLDDTQNVVRSFNPKQALPVVSTHFHKKVNDTTWQAWYALAKGNRGHIGWVDKWFDGKTPKDWHAKVAPHYKEIGQKISPMLAKGVFIDDKVAIYYSHASIQMSWIMDSVAHGSTWPNRNGDSRRGTYHMVARAWRKMLQDEGLQFTFINYVDVIQKGIPSNFKVLILPAVYCLSDAEAKQIKKFVENGGTLISDFLPAVFDQHGKAHPNGGALDDIFGLKQDMNTPQSDVFGNGLWVEVDQDTCWSEAGRFKKFLTKGNTCTLDSSGFNKAVKSMKVKSHNKFGKGQAYLMNLSPQWYNAYRQSGGMNDCKKRSTFMDPVKSSGVKRWVEIDGANEASFGHEIVYWEKEGRTIVFLVSNPDSAKTSLGGGNSVGLKTEKISVTLKFAKKIKNVKNERTGEKLKDGTSFKVSWQQQEAVVLSFEGHPYK